MGLCSSRSTERAPGGSSSDTRTTSSAPVDAKSSFQIPAPHWRWIYTHQEAHFCPVKSTPVWILPCFCRTTRINSFFSWFPLICVALSKFTDLQLCMQICCFSIPALQKLWIGWSPPSIDILASHQCKRAVSVSRILLLYHCTVGGKKTHHPCLSAASGSVWTQTCSFLFCWNSPYIWITGSTGVSCVVLKIKNG